MVVALSVSGGFVVLLASIFVSVTVVMSWPFSFVTEIIVLVVSDFATVALVAMSAVDVGWVDESGLPMFGEDDAREVVDACDCCGNEVV